MIKNHNPFLFWKETWGNIKRQWSSFFVIILHPLILVLLFSCYILFSFSSQPQITNGDNTETGIKLYQLSVLVLSVLTGIIGGIITKKWDELKGGGILVTRGKSAIRGLKLLLNNISAFERRVKIYLRKLSDDNENYDLILSNYEEMIDKCNSLQEEAVNAIEEWQDIIPEANIKTQIGQISSLKRDQCILEEKIVILSSEGEGKEQELKDKEDELEKIKEKLREKENYIGSTVLSGIQTTGAVLSNTVFNKNCSSCGNQFFDYTGSGNCPNCGAYNFLYPIANKVLDVEKQEE